MSSMQQKAFAQFYKLVVRHPEAHRRFLSLYVAGEERSEIGPLLLLHKALPPCALRGMLRRHLQDEGRHARMFRKRIDDLGGKLYPIPRELETVEHFRRGTSLGVVFELPLAELRKPEYIIQILLFNSVIEEFVLTNFMAHAEAAGTEDPRTYFMLMDIIADEVRHVIYTQEQAYLIAGTTLLDFAREKHQELVRVRTELAPRLFKATFETLLQREEVGLGLIEFHAWKTIANNLEKFAYAGIQAVPPVRSDHLVTEASPFGYRGLTRTDFSLDEVSDVAGA